MSRDQKKPARRRVLWSVAGSPETTRCKFCPGLIVWKPTPSGHNMPLSWASREPWTENGKQVGFLMEPHFADCPNWPKRSKKPKP